MFGRQALRTELLDALARCPAAVLVGPRQVGKTTLARTLVAPGGSNYFDLEDPTVEAHLGEPMTLLAGLRGLVVIDEIQRAPELFKSLRVLIDRPLQPDGQPLARVLLLGSASEALLRQSSETLAGRVALVEAGGFTIEEVGPTGLLHEHLGIANAQALLRHPRSGATWEGFVVEQVLRLRGPRRPTSGPRTVGPNSTCCCSRTADVSASRSSAATRRA